MLAKFEYINQVDRGGNPTGGEVVGTGLHINWQNGPLGRGDDRQEPNGAFVETVIAAVKQRIHFYQTAANNKYACDENQQAIICLEQALAWLDLRTRAREERQVEGLHVP